MHSPIARSLGVALLAAALAGGLAPSARADMADDLPPGGYASGGAPAPADSVDEPDFDAPEPDGAAPSDACDPLFDDDCPEDGGAPLAQFPDPWEPYNRGAMAFNRVFDDVVFDPMTKAYKLLPDPVEHGIQNALDNLDTPSIAINDALQLEWVDMATTLSRFVVNSTLGVAGVFDVGSRIGLERHSSDFGQTLAIAGSPSGPYVVLPVLGPTTVRDAFGNVADAAMNPILFLFGLGSLQQIGDIGMSGLALRADKIQELESLEKGSIDFYAALRSAFFQNRQAEIWSRREHRRDDFAR
ncbi:MAG: VacJ family lipoprotein [Myxococcota bacterium]